MKTLLRVVVIALSFLQVAHAGPFLTPLQMESVKAFSTPLPIDKGVTKLAFASYNSDDIPFAFYKNNKDQVLGELANHDVLLRAYSVDAGGKITFLTSLISGTSKNIVVQRDYINYKLVDVNGHEKKVGVLFRIEAELQTKQSNVDLNGLFAIGLAVKTGAASGQLRVSVHGLSGEPVSTLIPSPSDVSEQSIQNAMEAIALLKSKMYDPKVNIIPQDIPD